MNEKPDETLKEIPTYRGIPLVGADELEEQGWDTSDDYVIYPGQIKRPSPPIKI
jgi:hypothetical protein